MRHAWRAATSPGAHSLPILPEGRLSVSPPPPVLHKESCFPFCAEVSVSVLRGGVCVRSAQRCRCPFCAEVSVSVLRGGVCRRR